jgi:predicted site-specific integrase-resolvase
MPFFFDAAILSRMRSPAISRSNWAKGEQHVECQTPHRSFKASFISFRKGACAMPELVGYARVSTRDEQAAGLEHQIAQLKALGVADENLFVERASAVGERPVLEEALRFVRRGDIFVVCKLDRLARSIRNLSTIADDLKRPKGSAANS